jgi:Flp pilus assembly protein TadG
MTRTTRNQRGNAMIETPVAIVVMMVFGLGTFWVGNLVVRYHQLEEAVHSGARYAARASYAPNDGANRRRTAVQIANYVRTAAQPVSSTDPSKFTVDIRCSSTLAALDTPASECNGGSEPDPSNQASGTYIQVRASAVVAKDDPIMALGRSVNALFSTVHLGSPFPDQVTVTDSSVAIVE